MKRNLRQLILFALIVLMLINSACQPKQNYSPQSNYQEDIFQAQPEPQEQAVNMEPVIIFDNINSKPHSEFPPIPPTFTLTESWRITSILVCHWNHAEGVEPGEITLMDDQGNFYGTWQSEGFAPEPQFPNTYWRVKPDLVLGPGTYVIYDSDPATATYNTESSNMGMARVKGFPDGGYLNTEGIEGIVSIDSNKSEEGEGYKLETMQVKGVVTLPRGSGMSFSELTVETLTETASVDAEGVFETTSVHSPGMPQLAMALNQEGNPVLMGMFGAPELEGYGLSVESTARAFVLFDMAVLTLAPEQRARIAALLDKHPSYSTFQEMVAQAIIVDPVDPFLGDEHLELYEKSASITADLLKQSGLFPQASSNNQKLFANSSSKELLLPSPRGNSGIAPISLTQYNDINITHYIDVEDDNAFSSKVILVNKSMVYYAVDVTVDGISWIGPGASSTIYLVRNNLYGTVNLEWPPLSYRSTYEPEIGDGLLSFTFKKDKEMTLLDLFLGAAATIFGIGEMKTGNKGIQFLLASKGFFADGIQDLMQSLRQHDQMSYSEAVIEYSRILGWNGGKLIWDISEFMIKEEISNAVETGLMKRVLKFTLKKLAKPAVLLYGSADALAIIYSYNSAPDSVVFKDEQRFGIYPAVKLECRTEAYHDEYTVGNPIHFYQNITGIPKTPYNTEAFNIQYYLWDFDNGNSWQGCKGGANEDWPFLPESAWDSDNDFNWQQDEGCKNEGWTLGPEYEFITEGNYNVKVTAFALDRPVAECYIPMRIGDSCPPNICPDGLERLLDENGCPYCLVPTSAHP